MSKHGIKLSNCANCNHALENEFEFCPQCGQENHDIKVPVFHLGYEFLEGFTHFDTKVFNTLKSMFTKPGLVTKEFLEGKRVKYVPPPRFYIFISVIFFLLLGNSFDKFVTKETKEFKADQNYVKLKYNNKNYELTTEEWMNWMQMDKVCGDSFLVVMKNPLSSNQNEMRDTVYQLLKKAIKNRKDRGGLKFNAQPALKPNADITFSEDDKDNEKRKIALEIEEDLRDLDSIYTCEFNSLKQYSNSVAIAVFSEYTPFEIDKIKNSTDEEIDSMIIAKGDKPNVFTRAILKKSDIFKGGDFHAFIPVAVKAFSFSMFFLMPIIAFFTFIIFRRKRKFYVEHLIFSIHMHSFVFLVYSIFILVGLILPESVTGTLFLIVLLGLWAYFIVSLKTVFEESWLRSFFKFFFLSLIYVIISNIFSIISLLYGFITY